MAVATARAALEAALAALDALEAARDTSDKNDAPPPPSKGVVVALFDYTTLALQPWLRRGYECHAYDARHPPGRTRTSNGVHLWGVDLADAATLEAIARRHAEHAVFAFAFPPCTELSRAGAVYWKRKAAANPDFQRDAADLVVRVDATLAALGCPYALENPASSALRSLWRPPDHTFEPCWYGGYLAADDAHPLYPAHIPLQDAYTKRTGLWVGGGFGHMPAQRRVEPTWKYFEDREGKRRRVSPPLFSGSVEARQARQATPRGFSEAVCALYAR